MGCPSRFSPEVRERAVRTVEEHREAPRLKGGGAAIGGAEARLHGGDAADRGHPSVHSAGRVGRTARAYALDVCKT